MNKKKTLRAVSLTVGTALAVGTLGVFAGCGGSGAKSLVVMTEELNGLFNPFYATAGSDMDIVGQTQIGMFTTKYVTDGSENGDAALAWGDNEAVVVKDYQMKKNGSNTEYYFVIKNGIKFSDGVPLTINDVLFNMYVYLDPVYTGSTTMYSTDIVGLKDYRTQKLLSEAENDNSEEINSRAQNRLFELVNLFNVVADRSALKEASEEAMRAEIAVTDPSFGYKSAIAKDGKISDEEARAQLLEDYNTTLTSFREELENDYKSAKDAYTESPYKETGEFDAVTSFMYAEGLVDIEYARDPVTNKKDKSKIAKVERNYPTTIKTEEAAIDYVYETKVSSAFDEILTFWGTAQTMMTDFVAKATDVVLHEGLENEDGSLTVPTIKGIVSLGHNTALTTVTVNGTDYTIARAHNPDGTPVNSNEYDVLCVTINGNDPKAIWNFAFTVAPQHYYAEGRTVDIAHDQFGVEWGSFDFMKKEIQSQRNLKVPMGAGPYVATNESNGDNPDGNAFFRNNIVYFKGNENFLLGAPKISKLRYQVVSASNALAQLESGKVHFVTPQYTLDNYNELQKIKSKGYDTSSSWQLGYGYIGINAGKVQDINLRKAIMSAMDVTLSTSYYATGTAKAIYWPMSTVSWAYPKDAQGKEVTNNGHDYTMFPKGSNSAADEQAKVKIKKYMQAAGVAEGDSRLKLKFTIAGTNLTDHPTYATFRHAEELLNDCGWDVEVVSDTQALTKLSTGSLAVWAAAWGSTVDPDMYQVYHKNSTATSVLAWGYREIKSSPSSYPTETTILNQLSDVIDQAREVDGDTEAQIREQRTALYEEAMGYVLDLAIEMPVYQRKVLYAYNTKVIKASSLPATVNPFSTPLERIWEVEFAN